MTNATIGSHVLGPIDIQKMASRKWWIFETRRAACFKAREHRKLEKPPFAGRQS